MFELRICTKPTSSLDRSRNTLGDVGLSTGGHGRAWFALQRRMSYLSLLERTKSHYATPPRALT